MKDKRVKMITNNQFRGELDKSRKGYGFGNQKFTMAMFSEKMFGAKQQVLTAFMEKKIPIRKSQFSGAIGKVIVMKMKNSISKSQSGYVEKKDLGEMNKTEGM